MRLDVREGLGIMMLDVRGEVRTMKMNVLEGF